MAISQQLARNSLSKYLPYLVALALLAAAAWYFTRPEPPHVQLVNVGRGLVEATVSNTRAGTVKACHRAKLSAPSGGQIAHLLAKRGEQAQARLAQEQLITAQTQAKQSCLQADLAEKEAGRSRQLQAKGFISNEGLD